ncbi:hypothetical protein B4168_2502 [Anoxybacillus flavithermus]|nr:hypothetical protein B4168_2502 [Anoxybacillus flavithermus]OAO85278.1 hypothetical protein GT23_2969 [Parageobacillus thermoglucosidasius]
MYKSIKTILDISIYAVFFNLAYIKKIQKKNLFFKRTKN